MVSNESGERRQYSILYIQNTPTLKKMLSERAKNNVQIRPIALFIDQK